MEVTSSGPSELQPVYTKYQLASHITNLFDLDKRMDAAEDGWLKPIKQRMIDACLFYGIEIPYWVAPSPTPPAEEME